MDWKELEEMAQDLSKQVSRFELAELDRLAERGKGRLARLTRWERGEINRIYEHNRKKRGV